MRKRCFEAIPLQRGMIVGFLAAMFIAMNPAVSAETVELKVQWSEDLKHWESIHLTEEFLSLEGRIFFPVDAGAAFFRLQIEDAGQAVASGPQFRLVVGKLEAGLLELEIARQLDEGDWQRAAITPDLLTEAGGVIQPVSDPFAGEFVYIPGGTYTRGDHVGDSQSWDGSSNPVHEVYVSGFCIAKTVVTYEQWRRVYDWAIDNGYSFDNAGDRGALNNNSLPDTPENNQHPVVRLDWFDAVKWCNARSEMEGLTSVYYTDDAREAVYRAGRHDVTNQQVRWEADGYRLPTEAEWEKAARGGLHGKAWAWGDADIDTTKANFWGSSETNGTTRVDSYPPNGYGLYDMAGNVWEKCWDWFDEDWYENDGATKPDTHGPASGNSRVLRGSSWHILPGAGLRVAHRYLGTTHTASPGRGFRLVQRMEKAALDPVARP